MPNIEDQRYAAVAGNVAPQTRDLGEHWQGLTTISC